MIQIAVFASGNGTNAESIIKHFQGHLQLKVELLASNNSSSNALKRAKKYNIPYITFFPKDLQQ